MLRRWLDTRRRRRSVRSLLLSRISRRLNAAEAASAWRLETSPGVQRVRRRVTLYKPISGSPFIVGTRIDGLVSGLQTVNYTRDMIFDSDSYAYSEFNTLNL